MRAHCSPHCDSSEPRKRPAALPPPSGRIQRKAQCACGGSCPRCSQPGDRDEVEADRTAARIMRKAGSPATSGSATTTPAGGQPLPAGVRSFFEPRFGHDFSSVRVHADHAAAESAQSLSAIAYTSGEDIVFNRGAYQPESASGRELLAHELTHVVQQRGSPNPRIQRQAIGASCSAHQQDLQDAWDKAVEMTRETIGTLNNIKGLMTEAGGPRAFMPSITECLTTAFGEVGGLDGGGGVTFLQEVISRFEKILGGFTTGRTLRCDWQTVGANECDWRDAFVVKGNKTEIFICDAMLAAGRTVNSRAATLIHEMAHSVLGISHDGIAEKTFPPTFFDHSIPLGLDLDVAKKNAFAFEICAACMHGDRASSKVDVKVPPGAKSTGPGSSSSRFSLGATGGVSLDPQSNPTAVQGLAGIAGRLSLRPGSLVIFNPYIGLNALYAPTTSLQPKGFFAGAAEVGLRIQKPSSGPFVDVSAGGYLGFEAPLDDPKRLTGGFTSAVGLGWRWEHFEIGPEVRALVPGVDDDPRRVLVLGKAAARF